MIDWDGVVFSVLTVLGFLVGYYGWGWLRRRRGGQ